MKKFIKRMHKIKIKTLFIFTMDFCFNAIITYYGSLIRSPYKVFKLVFILAAPIVLTHQEAMTMAYQILLNAPNPKTGADCFYWIRAYVESGQFIELYYFLLQFSDLLDTLTPEEIRMIEDYLDSFVYTDDDAFDALIKTEFYTGDFNVFRQRITDIAEEYQIGPKYGDKPPTRR